jgi:DNA-binding transcriptional ArsR family regulator
MEGMYMSVHRKRYAHMYFPPEKLYFFSLMSDSFKALSNPQRLRIFLRVIEQGELYYQTKHKKKPRNYVDLIAEDLRIPQSTVSRHVKELIKCELVQTQSLFPVTLVFGSGAQAKMFTKFAQFFNECTREDIPGFEPTSVYQKKRPIPTFIKPNELESYGKLMIEFRSEEEKRRLL